MKTANDFSPVPSPQAVVSEQSRRHITIGLPAVAAAGERRFPLTPEGAGMLVEKGFTVKIEAGAGAPIHYPDNAYAREGARICDRSGVLGCDIVISLAPLSVGDIRKMRRGAMLLSMLAQCRFAKDSVMALLERSIMAIAIDLIEDQYGNTPFADILSEIDGRAAVAIASALLADAVHGKGILLGGVAGVVPCETVIVGSGISACAAARGAVGVGASVKIFDNDIYRLREATRDLGAWAVGSTLHPRVLRGALRSADVVIVTPMGDVPVFGADVVEEMKKGVIIFDLTGDYGKAFPSLPTTDLGVNSPATAAHASNGRCCYINAGGAVPRTAAMALSNTFLTFFNDITACDGVLNALKLLPGLQKAAMTFMGKAVNPAVASVAGTRSRDINLYLTLS
ncbi:hypothetical protein EEL49_08775 [Muribaculaceae bacterium Isolate-104 (HZI)]|nr:hypothetical protein EEL49_08775 [Muribaculaceae bacterium Isolate-104 (HZI)]